MLTYLTENPGCTKKQIVEALRPDVDSASDDVKALYIVVLPVFVIPTIPAMIPMFSPLL
jgi:hypothetical protein